MGKKKKKGGGRVNRLSPITKNGQIRLGTLLMEIGVGTQAGLSWNAYGKQGDWSNFAKTMTDVFLKPTSTQGAMFYSGLILALAGKLTGHRDFGLIRLS
jgi:hypothetical protein